MIIVVNRFRLWDKGGWIKIANRRRQFSNMLQFQMTLHEGFNLLLYGLAVGWRTVARDECSLVLNLF